MRLFSRATLAACLGFPVAGASAACGGSDAGGGQWAVNPGAATDGAAGSSSSGGGAEDAAPSPPTGSSGGSPATPDAGTTTPETGAPPNGADASVPTEAAAPPGPQAKRGIAYGYNSDADLGALSAGITWWYNWSTQPDSSLSAGYAASHGVEFVPMIWGGNFDPNKVASQVPAGAKYLLTFNEPNFGSQSNLTPAQAAALWPKVEQVAAARGLKIVSPAVNYCGGNCNETDPFTWLDAFFAACASCQVDYIAAHWYACTKDALTSYLSQYETRYKKPIWLTEFSCLDGSVPATQVNEAAYMAQAVPALEADPMVFRYSWFTGRFSQQPAINVLGAGSGSLTALGQKYIALPGGQ
jgi:hypothetical protein